MGLGTTHMTTTTGANFQPEILRPMSLNVAQKRETPKALLTDNVKLKEITMDNPLGKDLRLSWFGGFIDGEGCFYVQYCAKKSRKYKPWFKIANTDYSLLEYITKLFDDYNIAYHIYHRQDKRAGRSRLWYLQTAVTRELKSC